MNQRLARSTGNVFRHLGFEAPEAEQLRIRSTLMAAACRYMDERGLTRSKAAECFGVTQPRISDLVRGKIDLFSIGNLVDMLTRAGVRVEVVVSDPRHEGAST